MVNHALSGRIRIARGFFEAQGDGDAATACGLDPISGAAYRTLMVILPVDATALQFCVAALAYCGFVILAMRR